MATSVKQLGGTHREQLRTLWEPEPTTRSYTQRAHAVVVLALAAVCSTRCTPVHEPRATGGEVVASRPASTARSPATTQSKPNASNATRSPTPVVVPDAGPPAHAWLPLAIGCVRAHFDAVDPKTGAVRIGPVQLKYTLSPSELRIRSARWDPSHDEFMHTDCEAVWSRRTLTPAGRWLATEAECWAHWSAPPQTRSRRDCTTWLSGPWDLDGRAPVANNLLAFSRYKGPIHWHTTLDADDHCAAWEIAPAADSALRGELATTIVVDGAKVRRTRRFALRGQALHLFGGGDTQLAVSSADAGLSFERPNGSWQTLYFEAQEPVIPSDFFQPSREACLQAR